MKRKTGWAFFLILLAIFVLGACGNPNAGQTALPELQTSSREEMEKEAAEENVGVDLVTEGMEEYRGFTLDNVFHSETEGEIHYNLYIPDSYDGSTPYALFITLPGYEGLYFQGVGANVRAEEYGFEAQKYNERMIIAAPQLNDWGETSADQTIALTEQLISQYNIDPEKVYLEGMSGGGETGSLVMGKRPELYAAYLAASTQWDGGLEAVVQAETPVYFAVGEEDSYYGSEPLKNTYAQLHNLYREKGLTDEEIDEILVLDVKTQEYFSERGYSDQHAGGLAFASDGEIMGWLFSK